MKKLSRITILVLVIFILFSFSVLAVTPIEDRFEDFNAINKIYVIGSQNESLVICTNKPVLSTVITQESVPYYLLIAPEFVYYTENYDIGYRILYTDIVDGAYVLDGFIYTWVEDEHQYFSWYYPRAMFFYNIVRTNVDIPNMVDGVFTGIYFSKDSALNLLPIQQKQLDVLNSNYVVTCFVIFVILPLCGLIWYLKRFFFTFL